MNIAITANPVRFGAAKRPDAPLKQIVDQFQKAIGRNDLTAATTLQTQVIAALSGHVSDTAFKTYGETRLCSPLFALVKLCEQKNGFQPSTELRTQVLKSFLAIESHVQCGIIGEEELDILDPTGTLRDQ